MTKEMIDELVELEIFSEQDISKEEYEKGIQKKSDGIYMKYQGFDNELLYKKIDTKNITNDELNTQLQIQQLKMIKSIKTMLTFFVVITVIGIILSFIGVLNLS